MCKLFAVALAVLDKWVLAQSAYVLSVFGPLLIKGMNFLSRVCASRARTADGQGGLSPPEVVNCLLYFTGHLPIFPTAAQSTLRIYRLHARLVANRQRFDSSGTHAPPSGPTRRVGGHARAHSTQS